MCLGPMPGPLIDENATEWLTFTDTAAGVPVHFDFEFICNDSCSVYIKGTTWILKGSIFIFAELLRETNFGTIFKSWC